MKNDVEKLTAEKVAEIRAKGINFDDIPELTEEDFARGHFKYWNEVLRWAKMHGCPLVNS